MGSNFQEWINLSASLINNAAVIDVAHNDHAAFSINFVYDLPINVS